MIFFGIPYFCSQWIWHHILESSLHLSQRPQFSPHEDIMITPRQSLNKWNSSSLPSIYTHDTDVHINRLRPESEKAFAKTLKTANFYRPIVHFLTGDLSDDYKKLDWPKYSDQDEEAWIKYYNVLNTTQYDFDILECAGNHDMWGIKSPTSKSFNFLNYSKTHKDYHRLYEDVYVVDDFGKHPIIVLNPFRFPTGHSTLLYYPEPLKKTLDKLEKVVANVSNAILICHYPPDMWRKVKNSNGKTIRDIVENENINIILTGHTHPSYPKIRHHGINKGILEITGVGGMEHTIFGVVIEDNNRFSYHAVDVNDPHKGFVTYPIPLNQTNYHTAYAEEGTEIRVILSQENANIRVTGDCLCDKMKMHPVKINDNFYLYTCDLKIIEENENHLYTINFSGDFCDTIEFVYGNYSYQFLQETERSSPHNTYCEIYFTIALFIIYQLVLFPFDLFNYQKLEDWIEGKIDNQNLGNINNQTDSINSWKNFSIINILLSIFCGFVAVRSRILKAPSYVKVSLYLASLWPIALPTALMEIDKVTGFIFSYGYVCKGYAFSTDGPAYTLYYFYYVIFPFVILVSGISAHTTLYWTFAIDVLISVRTCVNGLHQVIVERLSETVGYVFMATSFCFTFIPLILLIIIIIWIIQIIRSQPKSTNIISYRPLVTTDD
ncbi:Ser/Thr protein phosphatase [Tritrichomonas foetus]|uniref:Ser/Thr protein phosphatase n=1 Tax=Tritrichomonas foetus TaxID=1144522 RepID=A0A1J4K1J1_9EUKA|nr:Ser/Thr protein phosphatase [Tritrichomonas foetus]|eukprot:OHT05255.1 Ser/Thr protein phosphatase [Tritrichomonas foetus]